MTRGPGWSTFPWAEGDAANPAPSGPGASAAKPRDCCREECSATVYFHRRVRMGNRQAGSVHAAVCPEPQAADFGLWV